MQVASERGSKGIKLLHPLLLRLHPFLLRLETNLPRPELPSQARSISGDPHSLFNRRIESVQYFWLCLYSRTGRVPKCHLTDFGWCQKCQEHFELLKDTNHSGTRRHCFHPTPEAGVFHFLIHIVLQLRHFLKLRCVFFFSKSQSFVSKLMLFQKTYDTLFQNYDTLLKIMLTSNT